MYRRGDREDTVFLIKVLRYNMDAVRMAASLAYSSFARLQGNSE